MEYIAQLSVFRHSDQGVCWGRREPRTALQEKGENRLDLDLDQKSRKYLDL